MQNLIIPANAEFSTEIKKSKFISFVFYVQTVEEIKNYLNELNKKYGDATHICYAYVVKDNGIKEKAVDNGEPSGTAGKPILDCIKKQNFVNMLVAVVRYFGGIKLGAGGLVRAYSQSAKNVIEQVKHLQTEYVEYETLNVEISYVNLNSFKNYCEKNNVIIEDIQYLTNINIKLKIPKGKEINFESYKNWSSKEK